MKKILIVLSFFVSALTSCYKTDVDVLNYLKIIKSQNDSLRSQVLNLQKTTDSMLVALKLSNQSLGLMDKKLDSIKIQLVSTLSKINELNTLLIQENANIIEIKAQLAILQAKIDELNALISQCCSTNSWIKDGRILYYPFSGNANDSSGNSYHGTVYNATLTQDRFGNANKAYKFNGIENSNSSQIICSKTVFNIGQNEYSIHFWFKPDNLTQVTRTFFNTIPHTGLAVAFNDNNAPGYVVYDVGPANAFWTSLYKHGPKNDYKVGQWYCATLIKSGTTYSFFINGVLEHTQSIPAAASYNYDVAFRISGISDYTVGYQNFAGDIDDFSIYNRALTPDQISYLAAH